jgi:hypothetical protein
LVAETYYRQICYRVSGYMNQRQEVALPDDPLVRVQESRGTLATDVILRLLGVRCLKQPALI